MGAFTSVTVVGSYAGTSGRAKRTIVTAVGPASYDAGGSVVDCSMATLGKEEGFVAVLGINVLNITPVGSHKYVPRGLVTADPATTKVVIWDHSLHPGAQVAGSENLSTTTLTLEIVGY